MVNQKHRYRRLILLSQGLISIKWCCSIMPFACQDLATHIRSSQITRFFCVFSGTKTLSHGESKTQIRPIAAFEPRFDLHVVVWYYHAFYLPRLGFVHQNFIDSPCATLPENLLQLPPVDMQANPILLLFYFQVNSKKLFLHSNCAQCTVTVHNAQ